jgi:hypothetical protein
MEKRIMLNRTFLMGCAGMVALVFSFEAKAAEVRSGQAPCKVGFSCKVPKELNLQSGGWAQSIWAKEPHKRLPGESYALDRTRGNKFKVQDFGANSGVGATFIDFKKIMKAIKKGQTIKDISITIKGGQTFVVGQRNVELGSGGFISKGIKILEAEGGIDPNSFGAMNDKPTSMAYFGGQLESLYRKGELRVAPVIDGEIQYAQAFKIKIVKEP